MLRNFRVTLKDGTILRAKRTCRQAIRESFGECIFTVISVVAGPDDLVGREVRTRGGSISYIVSE